MSRLRDVRFDSAWAAALLLAFVATCVKKWEPGGNTDALWYATVARNIAESGDYFRFYMSKHFFSAVYDHMPMDYWLVATLMRWGGVSDFMARLYPMLCSFGSCLLVFAIAARVWDRRIGLLALLLYILSFPSTKWFGTLLHDVPLTFFFLLATHSVLRANARKAGALCLLAASVGCAVLTKGPVIAAWVAVTALYLLLNGEWRNWRKGEALLAACVLALLLALPALPWVDGKSYYRLFYDFQKARLVGGGSGHDYFAFPKQILFQSPISALALLASLPVWWRAWRSGERWASVGPWFFLLGVAVIVPFSLFATPFPHYILPAYPFVALLGVPALLPFFAHWHERLNLSRWIFRGALLVLALLAATPIKISGKRTKAAYNLVNLIKQDTQIAHKRVAWLGTDNEWMDIFQSFKFYGGIDAEPHTRESLANFDLRQGWIVLRNDFLPLRVQGRDYHAADCFARNGSLCALVDGASLRLKTPDAVWPHEVYPTQPLNQESTGT